MEYIDDHGYSSCYLVARVRTILLLHLGRRALEDDVLRLANLARFY